MFILSSSNTSISSTLIEHNLDHGLFVDSSFNSSITLSSFENNSLGFFLEDSFHSFIFNNSFSSNRLFGFYALNNFNTTLSSNSFFDNRLLILEASLPAYTSYTVLNNTLDGKKLGWYTSITGNFFVKSFFVGKDES